MAVMEYKLNSYHIMWLFVMFDLPPETKSDKKNAALFRKELTKDGFTMYQYSVYIRHCASSENMQVHIKRIRRICPIRGVVSILAVTDKQYSNITNIWGSIEKKKMYIPVQLELF